jgi:hypothetical protein
MQVQKQQDLAMILASNKQHRREKAIEKSRGQKNETNKKKKKQKSMHNKKKKHRITNNREKTNKDHMGFQ